MGATMTTTTTTARDSMLDLTKRLNARERRFMPGSSVWLREDVRVDDGASRVIPAVFAEYGWRSRRCSVIRTLHDDGSIPRTWAELDDVIARNWGDDVPDMRPRMVWARPAPETTRPGSFLIPLLFLVVSVGLPFLVAFVFFDWSW